MTTPVSILQNLLRFDTTNPPGNEYLAISWARELLAKNGIQSTLLAKDPDRPNLVARIKGRGDVPPLLLQGHVDVVSTEGQKWTHPPFASEIHDGFVWGRGTLDMKGGLAMMISAVLKAHNEQTPLPGDVILCLLADEEAGSEFGAGYLVQEYAQIFEHVRFALGESGGFNLQMMGKTFYPIMVAEKQICWLEVLLHGPGGHASMIHRNGTMARLGQILQTLNQTRLPVHITKAATQMINGLANGLDFPVNRLIQQLLNPRLTDLLLNLLGDAGNTLDPLLHNTVNATIVSGGDKINVIPSEIRLNLDGRLLPGFTPQDLIHEVRHLVGEQAEINLILHNPGPPEPNMALFPILGEILQQMTPGGYPLPLFMPGVTDAAYFSRLGIQTYGFLPMILPEGFDFIKTVHAEDERIPIEALDFGTQAIFEVLQRFGEASPIRL